MERDVTPAAARIIQDRKETMNILKLAKHLKEFTLDEIEMIAEDDCKTELKQLLNEHKLLLNNGLYKYIEQENSKTFELIEKQQLNVIKLSPNSTYCRILARNIYAR